jgi:hypothetical protein
VTDAEKLINTILETEDEDFDDAQEVAGPPEHTTGINDGLMAVLKRLGVSADRVSNRYSDTYVMCATYQEAYTIANAGPWKSMADVFRTNPEHPDAKQWPWGVDIPFANLSAYMGSKLGEAEDEDFDDDWKDVADLNTPVAAIKGQQLADEYAKALKMVFRDVSGGPANIWGRYEGGGWISIRGESLAPHPDLADRYPNGWSLLHRVRASRARFDISYIENHRQMPPPGAWRQGKI